MLPSVSDEAIAGRHLVLANPGSRRVALLQAALAALGLPPARVGAYADLIAGRVVLPDVVRPGDIVRIESPGQEWEGERALLGLGAAVADEGCYERVSPEVVASLPFERGRIRASRQWYLGWQTLLERIAFQLDQCPDCRITHSPA